MCGCVEVVASSSCSLSTFRPSIFQLTRRAILESSQAYSGGGGGGVGSSIRGWMTSGWVLGSSAGGKSGGFGGGAGKAAAANLYFDGTP